MSGDQERTDFSHEDILAKMDALLKKHHIGGETAPAAESDFPILTEIVEIPPPQPERAEEEILIDFDLDTAMDYPVLEEILPPPDQSDTPTFAYQQALAPEPVAPTPPPEPRPVPASTGSRPVIEKETPALLEQKIADHIIASMDTALGNLLVQFSTHLESMVRETVAQEINRQLTALLQQDEGHGSTPE